MAGNPGQTGAAPGLQKDAIGLAQVQEALRPALCDADGKWTADYVRLRFSARKI